MRLKLVLTALLATTATSSFASDVQVNGYVRKDGTYVAPHVRSTPDTVKFNNYGSDNSNHKSGYSSSFNAWTRDSDHDGVANQFDYDDNNNGVGDDYEN